MRRRALVVALTGVTAALLLTSACGGGSQAPGRTGSAGSSASQASAPLAKLLPSRIRSSGRIVAGAELTVAPMIFYKSDATTVSGVNDELAQAMGQLLGVTITFKQYAFAGLEPALTSGKIDMIFDVINDTKQREQRFNFIDYVKSGNTLLISSGNPAGIKSLGDMCGHSMSAVRGSVQIELVQAQSDACVGAGRQPIAVKQYPSAPEARLQVQNGKDTAFIGNTPVLVYLAKTAGGGKVFDAVPVQGAESYYGIATAKSDTQLRDALLAALQKVVSDGTYAKILDKYGLSVIAMSTPQVNVAQS
jgi:polar amino acid transport system substrate-binding protein